jgi:hypothetical protein
MRSQNRDQHLYDHLIALKRHLRSCRKCIAARKIGSPRDMCDTGLFLTMKAADYYDAVISLKISASKSPVNTVYPCPDMSKHGKSYPLVTEPVIVTGYQDGLF